MKNCIDNAVLSFIKSSCNNEQQSKDVSDKSKANINLVNYRNKQQDKIRSKCTQGVGCRKERIKDWSSNRLGYSTISERNIQHGIGVL